LDDFEKYEFINDPKMIKKSRWVLNDLTQRPVVFVVPMAELFWGDDCLFKCPKYFIDEFKLDKSNCRINEEDRVKLNITSCSDFFINGNKINSLDYKLDGYISGLILFSLIGSNYVNNKFGEYKFEVKFVGINK
jgi:hypothetical protein